MSNGRNCVAEETGFQFRNFAFDPKFQPTTAQLTVLCYLIVVYDAFVITVTTADATFNPPQHNQAEGRVKTDHSNFFSSPHNTKKEFH